MITKDFNLVYRSAVSLMLRKMRSIYLKENPRVSDAYLARQLMIQPNTFSRLYRGCFSASPVVLMRLYVELGPELFDSCCEASGLIKFLLDENPDYQLFFHPVPSIKCKQGELIPRFVDCLPGSKLIDNVTKESL